jgi:hypothetical protein
MHASDRWVLWAARGLWALLPVLAGPSFATGLDERSASVQLISAIGLWCAWVVVLGAMFVPTIVTLTVVRIVAPASILAAALLAGHGGFELEDGIALAATIAASAACLLPAFGAMCLRGAAYGDEERVALRAPGALLLGPIELSWLVLVVSAAAGPLLLAARQWVAGAAMTVVGVTLVVVIGRALHQLSRRWLVFVPAGVVVHDPLGLVDPILLRRARVRAFAPAPADTKATDLTMAAPGLAVEISLLDKVELASKVGRSGIRPLVTSAVLVTPTRPGVAISTARRRRVGQLAVRAGPSPSP